MVEKYDKIFITNLPAFYKINLYNAIGVHLKVLVLYTWEDAQIRNMDFFAKGASFDFQKLSGRNKLEKALKLKGLLSKIEYEELIIGGWDSTSAWVAAYCSSNNKNSLVIESSEFESTTKGIKGLIKRIFLKRISKVYASGSSQRNLVLNLGFKHEIIITKGVGLFNIIPQPAYKPKDEIKNFIYVGRLSEEKNLLYLLETFKDLPDLNLSIVGYGPLEPELKKLKSSNVTFYGSINNSELPDVYQKHDVFILPSYSEPWGLVVEEALNNGIPVIVSNRVGCSSEIVKEEVNGLVFHIEKKDNLKECILKMLDAEYYNRLRFNISKYDFNKIANEQIKCYL